MQEDASKSFSLLGMVTSKNLSDPFSVYRTLREHDPVHWDPYLHAWIVTSYQETLDVLAEYSADRTPTPLHLDELGLSVMRPFAEMMQQQMMFMDGAKHKRLRNICSAAFTPRRVQELRGQIESIANDLLERVIQRGQMDMINDFANPLPAIVTARLLGLPIEDHQQLHAWVVDLAELLGNYQHHPDRVAAIVQSLADLRSYLAKQMTKRRAHPTSSLLDSLMTIELDGNRLSDDEIVANTIITLIGGHETTTNLIASGFLTLLQNPASFEQLRQRPVILASAVEELLRYESPVQHTARIAPDDVQLNTKMIRKGSRVVAVLAAANRDPARFPDPDRLDLLRADNRHIAFGWAAHFCFGAALARVEAQIAFAALLRLSNPRLVENRLEWRQNAGLRGLLKLPISFDRHLSAAVS